MEYEYSNEFPEALIYYQKAYKVCLLHLGSDSSVSNLFLHHFEDAKQKIEKVLQFERMKPKKAKPRQASQSKLPVIKSQRKL